MAVFGEKMRRLRLAAGRSLSDLARDVNYSKSHLSKVETGTKKASPELARMCDAALGARGALAALVPPRTSGGLATRDWYDQEPGPSYLRMERNGSGEYGAAAVQHAMPVTTFDWLAPARGPRHPDDLRDYDGFRQVFDALRSMGQHLPAAVLLPMLIAHTEALSVLAATRDQPELWRLGARFAEYTGWMAQESGNDGHALHWTQRAVGYAAAGGDHRLGAYSLVRRAEIAIYQTRPRETVELARRAQEMECGGRIRGLAAQREAQGHAMAGNAPDCERALDRAARWLAEPDTEGSLPLLGSSNVADLTGMATGFCLFDLGRPRRAGEYLRTELDRTPPTAHRMRARIGARYVLALVGGGEVEQGCAEVPQLLAWYGNVESATVRTDLSRLLRALNRWPAAPHVRRVVPELTAALSRQG